MLCCVVSSVSSHSNEAQWCSVAHCGAVWFCRAAVWCSVAHCGAVWCREPAHRAGLSVSSKPLPAEATPDAADATRLRRHGPSCEGECAARLCCGREGGGEIEAPARSDMWSYLVFGWRDGGSDTVSSANVGHFVAASRPRTNTFLLECRIRADVSLCSASFKARGRTSPARGYDERISAAEPTGGVKRSRPAGMRSGTSTRPRLPRVQTLHEGGAKPHLLPEQAPPSGRHLARIARIALHGQTHPSGRQCTTRSRVAASIADLQ
ncbi:hypothetical protein SKAU_G00068750 [Synaphobranchus kaupii]|uniref:Uncharacterized protein n=1 Tax=Synaphobranchus kaupii TaxID=118154 RepID=A0A9Q1G7W7_SYNKA|nr:hypothetical protein SKAU_G00068750 [Synaphobranchus kaupii]